MRLLQMCTNFRPGGIQRHVLDLTGWLRDQGHCVSLAGTPGLWMSETIDRDFLPLDIQKVTDEGGTLSRRLAAAAKAAWKLRSFVRRERIALIHAHEGAPALVAWLAMLGRDIPVIVTYHGSEPERVREFGRIAKIAANLVVTPSHNSARDLREAGGVSSNRLKVIGLGVERKLAPSHDAVARLRQTLLGEDGRLLVVSVARLAHQKGIDWLVEIVRRAVATDPSLRFVVIGNGPQSADARRWAQEAGVEDHLAFVGHSDEAQLYMAAADLFLLPSRWESLPITIVEAFRQGLPVVATDTGGVVELVDESVGRVAAVGDIAALTAHVLEITGGEELRSRLSQAARLRSAEDRFSPPFIHAIFAQTYRRVIGGEDAP